MATAPPYHPEFWLVATSTAPITVIAYLVFLERFWSALRGDSSLRDGLIFAGAMFLFAASTVFPGWVFSEGMTSLALGADSFELVQKSPPPGATGLARLTSEGAFVIGGTILEYVFLIVSAVAIRALRTDRDD